jgi:RNA polymerase sigma-70 factor (ECF subfamily)
VSSLADSDSRVLTISQKGTAGDERDLIRAAQERPEAFGALYERHLDRVYRFLQLRVGREEAADLTQQVFLRAFTSLPSYKSRGVPFVAWLFRIARNLAADHHRSSSRLVGDLLPDIAQAASVPSPEEVTLQTERRIYLRSLVSELDDDKRELLAMRFAAGLTSREIAAVMGKSEAATKKQLTRIVRSLKEKYREGQ